MNTYLHNISPEKVVRGENAFQNSINLISNICKKPLLLGRSKSTIKMREELTLTLNKNGLTVTKEELKHDCCEIDIKRISKIVIKNSYDGIIAAGGGKVLDAGKLIADQLKIPSITIPLSPSTCAGWTALSNIYSPTGAFVKDIELSSCPKLLIFDYGLVRQAPRRLLASGIADALAKWYEASLSSGSSNDGLIQQAVQMSRVLRDQLLIDGQKALDDPKSAEWIKVAEGCSLTAGVIGGIGGTKCRSAAAHAVHNGLTQLSFTPNKALHGELVGFGILVQLSIEEIFSDNKLASQSKSQLLKFLIDIGIPIDLESLGLLDESTGEIARASLFSCNNNSDIHDLPFPINENILTKAIMDTNYSNKQQLKKHQKNYCT